MRADARAEIDALLEAVRSASSDAELRQLLAPLVRRASEDALTKLANRARLAQVLSAEVQRALRYGRALSLVVVDLDRFKQLNDSRGHREGDRALQGAAALIRRLCRSTDLPARLGGDEFAVVLPETPPGGAAAFAEKIRGALEAAALPASLGTASLGSDGSDADDLLDAADRRLYRAKTLGGNRVEAA
jgi:diguanylate cyclase (GGDEF)-like protein